jgi:outer membrane protein assembly factor BamB
MMLISRIAAAATLVALGLAPVVVSSSPVSASAGTALTQPRATRPQIPGGARLWQVRYDGGAGRSAVADSVAASPDGSTVYVSGLSGGASEVSQVVTIAYNAATGAVRWMAVYRHPHHHPRGTTFVAVSPDGSQVFVEASVPKAGEVRFDDHVTLAYNAATGRQEWATLTPAEYNAALQGLAVSPDGSAVYITGLNYGPGSEIAYQTLALSAATGAQTWGSSYPFRRNSNQTSSFIAVSPDGSEVFVTGQAGVVAYDAATGEQAWAVPYELHWQERFQSLAVSPDSSTLFVTGKGSASPADGYVTIAYDAATGARLWRAHAAGRELSQGASVAVSPDSSTVYVTGNLQEPVATTIAYNAATGAREWISHYDGLKNTGASPRQVAVSADGSTVYVMADTTSAAGLPAYLVIAYDAATGTQLWTGRFGGPSDDPDYASDMVVSGTGVFVTGHDQHNMATVAFQP